MTPTPLDQVLLDRVATLTGAGAAHASEHIQTLWSGYGEIWRVALVGADVPSVVVKRVEPPSTVRHKRGWNTSRAHQRKLRSYEVERRWYETHARRCGARCRVPQAVDCSTDGSSWVFVLEDLDASGFSARRHRLSDVDLEACLAWLAHFHALYLRTPPSGLWRTGTYWHLATRPDELAAMPRGPLRQAAAAIDAALSNCAAQTLVHGDAKVANFCFSQDGAQVAAVDFQYVGGGCGMKDVAYFLGSCLDEAELEARTSTLLDSYFRTLTAALDERQTDADPSAIEAEWRSLYPLAWADFHRFLDGWAPGHGETHDYTRTMTAAALEILGHRA